MNLGRNIIHECLLSQSLSVYQVLNPDAVLKERRLKRLCYYIGWSEQMSDTVEKLKKIYKKHCFGYIKKFIPWRYLLLYLCENKIFSTLIYYIDHFINKKRSKDITKWSWPGHAIFTLSKTAPNSRETLLHILCYTFGALCRNNSTKTFLKRRMMALSNAVFLSESFLW